MTPDPRGERLLGRVRDRLRLRRRWRAVRAATRSLRPLGAVAQMADRLRLSQRWRMVRAVGRSFGAPAAAAYAWGRARSTLSGGTAPDYLFTEHALHPLLCRAGASDREVFGQIFIEREYSCLDGLRDVELVVDCGANVGYSAAYFLTRFPGCRVIAVEPDAASHAVLAANLVPYGDRAMVIRSAVWSRPTGLRISEEIFRDGREWATQVRACRPGEEPQMMAVDLGMLLRESGAERISILKVDIEGAEAEVFATNTTGWLPRVDNIVIELHDDSSFGPASDIFAAAIADRNYVLSRSGELTVCRSARPPS